MKKYLIKSFLFFLPVLLICGPCLFFLYLSRELDDGDDYIMPLNDDQLIGLAYTDIREAYKYNMTDRVFRPDVIALGSSRIMQVKSTYIRDDYSFYNAGGAANNIYQYQLFLSKLHYTPSLFIISIDQWLFNPNYQNQKEMFNPGCYEFSAHNLPEMLNTFISDMFNNKIDFRKILSNEKKNIGLNAIINMNGYMRDGTHYEGNLIDNPLAEDYNFIDTFDRIEHANRRFEYCEHADSSQVEVFSCFLDECEKKGIVVMAIIPPFAPAVYQAMIKKGTCSYMSEVYDILLPCFLNHKNCYVYDYTDMLKMNVHNYDFLDGFHGSELIYNIILQDILEKNDQVRKYFKSITELNRIENEYNEKHIRYHSLK